MKKMCFFLGAVLLLAAGVFAQSVDKTASKKAFVIFSGGWAMPTGHFGSSQQNNEEAGFARTGPALELQGGRLLNRNIGIAASVFYGQHKLRNSILNDMPGTIDHWQYWGVVGGLLVSAPMTTTVSIDFRASTGVASVNSPKATVGSQTVLPGDWTNATPVKLDGNLRFQLGKRALVLAGASYLYMDPKFKASVLGSEMDFHQKVNVLSMNVGIGLSF